MKRHLLLILLFFVSHQLFAQIASWDFTGQNTVATSTATTFDPGLTAAPVLSRGADAAASAGANSFRTTDFKNNGIALTNTDYFQVSFAASSGKKISLSSIDAKFAGTPTFYAAPGVSSQFAYSLDGTNFTLIGSPTLILASNLTSAPSISLSGIPALQNVAEGITITLRYYASGQTNTGGWGFNSASAGTNGLVISGTVANANATQPSLTATSTSLDFGNQTIGTTSAVQSYTLSATNLTNNVNLTTSAPFSISKDNVTFSTSTTYTSAELATSKTVYARFNPTTPTTSNDNILHVSTGASNLNVALTGTGITPPAHVVISEVYGGGGNSGASYKNDFIELYNPTNAAVDLTGWSVQYNSAAGTAAWPKTDLTGSIPAKGFYLIQQAVGAGGTVNLPTPDAIGTLALSGTTGKVILSNSNVALTGANPASATVIDKVGFGPTATGFETAPTPLISNTTSIERKASATSTAATLAVGGSEEFAGNGYDTDNNSADFVVTAPNPQNSAIKEPTGVNHLVISEVYGAGGNTGSVYRNDFIEIYNPTTATVSLTGWSVQYASATGTSWQVTPLSGSIAPKSFYLVQQAAGSAGTTDLPTPDKTGTISMAGGAGKVLLANVATAQTGTLPTGTQIIDLVGYGTTAVGFEGTGPAPVPTATFSVERKASATSTATTLGVGGSEEFAGNGYDTDDNAADFVSKTANPQNSSLTEPVSTSGPFLKVTPISLAFNNQAINTTSAAKTYVLSGGNLTVATTLSVTGPFTISKDNVTYATSLSFTPTDLTANQTVYVKFNPTAKGNITGAILHTSAGATAVSLALSGPAIDPNQTAFNFENCTTVGSSALSDGFYQYSVTGAQTWGCTTSFGHDASDATGAGSAGNALQINGFSGGNIQNEDWLISPALNLASMNYAILSFWTRSAFAGDKLQLKISTNYTGSGDPALATWISIDGKFPETASDKWTKSDHIDLTAYKATPLYIAIVYNSTTSAASRWTLDDFEVRNSSTPPAVDISVSPSSINFAFQAVNTTSAESTFGFLAGNLTGDVTVTAPANFSISKTSGGTFTNTLTYTKADINNTSPKVYAKFSPTTVNTTYTGNVTITTSGSANKTVALSGNTFDVANTLEVVNWNIEWFGSPAQDPSNDALQASNVGTIVSNLNADIYGFAEVVDTTLFRNTVLPAGYGVVFSEFGSYADDKADIDYPLSQKLAFMYRTDLIKPIKTLGILRDTYNPAVPATAADGTPYKNWSSGRFPYMLQAEVKINNKVDTVYFIEIHAKANTGTPAEQVDSYNRRKGGNLQMKNWIDANLAGKKVIILGDFNDVLDADKTIAPMPAGTGTSYSDFTKDVTNYFPITLPLSLAGKQSTAGFNTVIDNVIISKDLNKNYVPASAEVLDAVKNLVNNYSSTTTDHYPIKSRYLFGNGAPTLANMANQTICYTNMNQTAAVTGISAGPENTQTTTLAVSSDNPGLFDQLSIVANGADKATITYHLKNNTSAVANITVTVTDNGGTDFGGVNTTSKSFKLTVNALPAINISSNSGLSVSKGEALILTASGGTQYSWTGNDISNGQNTASITIRPKQSSTYKVAVTNANGCTTDQSINITVVDDYKLEAGTVITPNGDGINDKFIIKNLDYYPNNTLKIFDKAGRVLYTKQSYSNDWDGMINGSPLSEGTYYYILDMGTGIGTFKGYINIIRD